MADEKKMHPATITLMITTIVFAASTTYFGYTTYQLTTNFKSILKANPGYLNPDKVPVPKV